MRKLVAALCLIGVSAFAGERLLGIISEISTSTSNLSQNPDGQGAWWDGGFTQPFLIPSQALVTVVCDVQMSVCTDKTSCTVTEGVPVPPAVIFPTSVGNTKGVMDQGKNPDAGLFGGAGINPIRSAAISIINPVADGGYHACKVWERMGNE